MDPTPPPHLRASVRPPPRARSFVNDEGFMVTEDRWEDVEGTSASESKKASSPKKAKAAAGSDEPAKKKATSQGSMFSFFKKK